jgi:energy-coupling factor transporter ATP-binding protein EcfA2
VLLSIATRRVILIGGKGGVGKTTVATALASLLASAGHRAVIGVVYGEPFEQVGHDAAGRFIVLDVGVEGPRLRPVAPVQFGVGTLGFRRAAEARGDDTRNHAPGPPHAPDDSAPRYLPNRIRAVTCAGERRACDSCNLAFAEELLTERATSRRARPRALP